MTFQKKVQTEKKTEDIDVSFGVSDDTEVDTAQAVVTPAPENIFGALPRYVKGMRETNHDMCVVLYGYGIDAATYVKYVDDYTFIGGVCRNVPLNVAQAWRTGKRWQDGKPAKSRIYPQAILPNDATEVDFAKATGVQPMEPAKLAAMIGATDAKQLVAALGAKQAAEFMEEIRKYI